MVRITLGKSILKQQYPTQSNLRSLTLEASHIQHLASLCGQQNAHLLMIEKELGVTINHRGNEFTIKGTDTADVDKAFLLIQTLYQQIEQGESLSTEKIHLAIAEQRNDALHPSEAAAFPPIKTRKLYVKPRGFNQKQYVKKIRQHDINFGIGPAGTGKTYLAVACAVEALEKEQVERILLVRPAVEAGEKLGFLPGDLTQKVDPYLRPLYDALYEMLGFDRVDKLIERHVIEVAPLAFMRGRTLNNAFIILDESQNTTKEQMKMFLTRIGFGSTAVITGDTTQVDLPKGVYSGLKHAASILAKVPDISFTYFKTQDVVRHKLVQKIVEAYEIAESQDAKKNP